jgi:fatty acid synthase subunit alpha
VCHKLDFDLKMRDAHEKGDDQKLKPTINLGLKDSLTWSEQQQSVSPLTPRKLIREISTKTYDQYSKLLEPQKVLANRTLSFSTSSWEDDPFVEDSAQTENQTSSPRLEKVLESWQRDSWATPSRRQQLGYTILVELLAYQFASPVRWIETQDLLFQTMNISRVIEVGPSPVLTGMATRTLKAKYEGVDTAQACVREILCVSKNGKEIYYHYENSAPVEVNIETQSVTPAVNPVASAAEPIAMPPRNNLEPIADLSVSALDILLSIIAQKLKKSAVDLPLSKSIKELVGGKSTLQNEILGDLQAEFYSAPEKSEELPLEELGAVLNAQHSGSLGKQMTMMISRLISQKFPGGFPLSAIRSYLLKTWGLQPGRQDGVLVRGITNEPPARLGSEAEAKAWLDSTSQLYAKEHGVSLNTASTSVVSGPVMNSEEFDKFKNAQDEFAQQHVDIYMRYLGQSSRGGYNLFIDEKNRSSALQSKLDEIYREHGERYIQGISGIFHAMKVRMFNSAWNWVRQDATEMWYAILFGRLQAVDREITAKCIAIINRSDPQILAYIRFKVESCQVGRGPSYALAQDFAKILLENCQQSLQLSPKYKDVTYQTAPSTVITQEGEIKYSEVNRPDVRKFESYVKEMAAGNKVGFKLNLEKIQGDVAKLYEMVKQQSQTTKVNKVAIKSLYDEVVNSLNVGLVSNNSNTADRPPRRLSNSFISPVVDNSVFIPENSLPFLHLKRNLTGSWLYSKQLTSVYLDILTEIASAGSSFENTNALLTGCGRGSIGVEVLKGLLSGGCRVVVTTSSYSRKTIEFFQEIYQVYGSKGSKLFVVPFNQASKQDCAALIEYVYSPTGLRMDLDYVVPFAAISENGREIDSIDDVSELAHRLMLTNLIRLIGSIKSKKQLIGVNTRTTQIILPHSPNHGTFGGDGLYAESKVGLEPLFNKWKSESWGEYLSLVGAVIG